MADPVPLQADTPAALTARVPGLDLAEARKIVSAIHRAPLDVGVGCLAGPIDQVRRTSLAAVRAIAALPRLEVLAVQRSAVDPFVKYSMKGAGELPFEAVRIPLEREGRFSVCVSSQVGCALACAFCATGRMGLARNLAAWEIVEQVRVVREALLRERPGARVHGVVFQGMGEPLANLDRVLEVVEVLREPSALAIDARAVTVCTSGLPSGIRRLADEAPNVRLGLSIGSARPDARRRLMPIEGAHPLDEVLEACVYHARKTRNAPMWAYTLLAGENDGEADARALAARVHAFAQAAGVRPRLTLIPYNPATSMPDGGPDPFARASDAAEAAFRDALAAAGVHTHKRYSGGGDVGAACGQLATGSARR